MKYFGTDGFRGRANEGLNVDQAFKIGRFVGWHYGLDQGRKARIVIGKDTRRSSYMFESAIIAGLVASGADVYMLHVIPTPGVCYEVVDGSFDCGIMISASHNPYTDNGIKLVNREGYKMEEEVLEQIEAYIDDEFEIPLATANQIGCTVDYMQGRNRYIAHLISSANFSLQGVKVGLDCANGAASSVAKPVFDALGADVRVISNAPDGFNINVDCGSTHIERLQRLVVEQGLDVGFAYDGDADRCLAVDENGHVVDGDLILYICGKYLNKHGRLSGGTVVPTVMSNFGFLKALDIASLNYVTTAVGDKNVFACMRENGYSLGGEQSGHIIFGDIEKTGDGIMTSLRVMEVMRAERETLSELVRPVRLYPQTLVNVTVEDRDGVMASEAIAQAVAEAEERLAGNGRILVRASGTEPLVRVMVEAETEGEASEIAAAVADVVRSVA
ncbi:phosphoglucosamine mutase [Olsenella sp. YH-ols2217]|uniref:Phosphoglucosamine mutase n=1 Tax=Kribbibacterium absianum TaxID=3044210 RepID=A0ABT6ZKY6_9ACTN|nr:MULTISPECIES: phosphoglucosamine mutase [unclassified Olsenella]MDJ1122566.1 phosphoglucosamine mutase [Olsenella sp. YH-ols2216]MDJ1129474.1 phosphoglucosamine mutase [Olsenella sp. YH-ols2217]